MSFFIALLTLIHVVVAVLIILLVLMQKSSEQGVGAAFGGGMTETVFGAGTTTALVRMTIWCACLLLLTTLSLAVLHHSHRARTGGSLLGRIRATTPAAPYAPAGGQQALPPFTPATPGTAPATPETAPATPAAPAATQPASAAPASSQSASPPAAPTGKTP